MAQQMTSVINKNLYPVVKKAISSKETAFKNLVGNFIKKNSEKLYDIVPCDKIYFLQDEIDGLEKVLGKQTFDAATNAIKNAYYAEIPNFNPRAAKDEVTLILLCIVKYFAEKGNQKDLDLSLVYLCFSGKFYISVYSGIFPYPPDRAVMEYVLNYSMTSKFLIKEKGNVISAIISLANTWVNTYKKNMKDGDDEDMKDIIQQLRDRIKAFLLNIASIYYDAYENKDMYFAYDTSSNDQDNYHVAENNSAIIDRVAEASMNYITSNSVNYRFVKMSADTNVRFDELRQLIEVIQANNDNILLIKELVSLILFLYVQDSGKLDFRSLDFVSYTLVPKPNAKGKESIRQKEILEILLTNNSVAYNRRKGRQPTRNSYHRSLLSYYALIINHVAGKM